MYNLCIIYVCYEINIATEARNALRNYVANNRQYGFIGNH